jgi:hypothetical protein
MGISHRLFNLPFHTITFHEPTKQGPLIIYINLVSLCVCDGGFGGWRKGEASEAAGEKSGQVCL